MSDDDNGGCLLAVALAAVGVVATALIFYDTGFELGVEACAKGRWTAVHVQLPDGTDQWIVSKVKQESTP